MGRNWFLWHFQFFSLDFTKDSLWNLPTLDIYFCLLSRPKVWFLNILPLMGFEPENFFPHCVMWWGDLEIWLKLFSLGCQFISFIKKLFRWIPTARCCCCGWCTASLLSDINKSLLMNSDSCIELLWCKTRSVAMMYLVVISFKKNFLNVSSYSSTKTKSKIVKNDNFSVF